MTAFERYRNTPLGVPEFLNREFKTNGAPEWQPIYININPLIDVDSIKNPDNLVHMDFIFNFDDKIIDYIGPELTGRCLYSYLKNLWKDDEKYIQYAFPMSAITPEQFEFRNGWKPSQQLIYKITECGFSIFETGEKYAWVICLGNNSQSLVILESNNTRVVQTRKSFMIRPSDNVIIMRNIIDVENSEQYWKDIKASDIIGCQLNQPNCYRIPVA